MNPMRGTRKCVLLDWAFEEGLLRIDSRGMVVDVV